MNFKAIISKIQMCYQKDVCRQVGTFTEMDLYNNIGKTVNYFEKEYKNYFETFWKHIYFKNVVCMLTFPYAIAFSN